MQLIWKKMARAINKNPQTILVTEHKANYLWMYVELKFSIENSLKLLQVNWFAIQITIIYAVDWIKQCKNNILTRKIVTRAQYISKNVSKYRKNVFCHIKEVVLNEPLSFVQNYWKFGTKMRVHFGMSQLPVLSLRFQIDRHLIIISV